MYSLYENLIISTFLQNATIKRTIDMTYNMLTNYGKKIKFDNKTLFSLWVPKELNATDEELRKLKVGYRSKNILRITKYFIDNNIDEITLRKLSNSELEKELMKIYGVGKQTVFYLMLSQFHRTNFLKHIPLWERKIISKYIFNKELCSEIEIIDWLKTNYGDWYGFVLSLIIEDIFFKHKQKPFPWLKKILRED
jgi:3-methyladenine DNA glycosylase/8-oxoguanine DNA glycosylase